MNLSELLAVPFNIEENIKNCGTKALVKINLNRDAIVPFLSVLVPQVQMGINHHFIEQRLLLRKHLRLCQPQ